MKEKTLLILVDGMRPDSIPKCGHPFLSRLMQKSTYTMQASTVMPSVTLPCHTSLFFSVDPERHGITTNDWTPPVRPIVGLADLVAKYEGKAGSFYNWEQLRDLARPGSLDCCYYESLQSFPDSDMRVTNKAIDYIEESAPDFVFLYLGVTDEAGHTYGWMTEKYMEAVAEASACIEKIYEVVKKDYSVIITADHGGHERAHGLNIREDMTIPLILSGSHFESGKILAKANIKDIAPTIASIMGLPKPREWEGISLV